jgi:hypothetical protein
VALALHERQRAEPNITTFLIVLEEDVFQVLFSKRACPNHQKNPPWKFHEIKKTWKYLEHFGTVQSLQKTAELYGSSMKEPHIWPIDLHDIRKAKVQTSKNWGWPFTVEDPCLCQ